MINLGCTYQHSYPIATISIEFKSKNEEEFSKAILDFSSQKGLSLIDNSRQFPSGMKSIIFEITSDDGNQFIKINDLMDSRRFVVAIYEQKERKWYPLYKALFEFLKLHFPEASIETKINNKEIS